MFFKKSEDKKALGREIRAKRREIAEYKKLNRKWVQSFMAETQKDIARLDLVVLRMQAKRISEQEYLLQLMKMQYKLMR